MLYGNTMQPQIRSKKRESSKLRETICSAAGITPAQFEQHIKQREQILADLLQRDIRDIETVTKVIQGFYATR